MSMFIHSAIRSQHDASRAEKAASRLGRQLTTGRKIQTPEDGPTTWLGAGRAQATATFLDTIHAGLSEVATTIRAADTTMEAVGEHLDTMQAALVQAKKHGPADPARQQLIGNFNAIAQQIDDLVFTLSPAGARDLVTNPGGDVQVLVGINGEQKTVHAQPVDTGPNGLNVPLLSVSATDAEIDDALANLDTAQSILSARRQGLGADAGGISRYESGTDRTSSFYQGLAESLTNADAATAAVELQSVNLQRSLAMETLSSITTMRGAVLELLR